MIEMRIFTGTLIFAAVCVALVTGLVYTFAVVTMPGIKSLNDREFLRAFQVMDGIIQNNQPLFVLVWLGSIVSLLVLSVLGFRQLEGLPQWIIIGATVLFMLGVQLPTVAINVPLNNELQTFDVSTMNEGELAAARGKFEDRWNRSNVFRTYVSLIVLVLLFIVLLML